MDEELFAAAEAGDTERLRVLLNAHPEKVASVKEPYEHTLLHAAAFKGQTEVVRLLLERGLSPNVKERGDRTTPIFWAGAAGHVDTVKALIEGGADVHVPGDDHGLDVIGWASCWEGCDDDAHREVVDALVGAGARHHIFSAICWNLADEIRRIVAEDPGALSARLTRNDMHQTPLHHAVQRNRPAMVKLLMELGADPLALDSDGNPVSSYANSVGVDAPVMEAVRRHTLEELDSAERGKRTPNLRGFDLTAALALSDWPLAERLVHAAPAVVNGGALHAMARRGALEAVQWLIARGADVNAFEPPKNDLTSLHVAVWKNQQVIVRVLLAAGADPSVKDRVHNGDALDWADHFENSGMRAILESRT